MKRYVLLAGGTGARVADSLLLACCAGVFPSDSLDVLLADMDHRGLHSAEQISAQVADYSRVQEVLHSGNGGFHTALRFRAWPEKLPEDAKALGQWSQGSEADALLCQALLDPEAAQLDLNEGCHGRTMLGRAAFAGLVQAARENPDDTLHRLTEDMALAVQAGEEVRVVIAGSVCGGTGAAAIPALAAYVQEQTGGAARTGVVLLTALDEQDDADKARETLTAYARDGLCDTVCVLGLPESARTSASADYARLTDWLAVYCMDVLLHRPVWLEGVFTVRAEAGPLSWSIFGKAGERYCQAYGRLVKMASAWTYSVGPEVERRIRKPSFFRDRFFGWYPHYFRRTQCDAATMLEDAACLTRLSGVILLWLGGLSKSLPADLRHAELLRRNRDASRAHYAKLTELAGQLSVMHDDAEHNNLFDDSLVHRHRDDKETEDELALRRIDAVRAELERQSSEQVALNRQMGGAAVMEMLQEALEAAQADSQAQLERYNEANRRIDHAETIAAEADQYRITDARTKLRRMERHQVMLDGRRARIEQDIAQAREQQLRFQRPAMTPAAPENGIFQADMAEKFARLDLRDRTAVEAAWAHLVLPGDEIPLKEALKAAKKDDVDAQAPVFSLMQALMKHAM